MKRYWVKCWLVTLLVLPFSSIAQRVRLEGTGFYTWYRDAITTQPFLFQGQSMVAYDGQTSLVTANVNVGKSFLYGFSGTLNADVTATFWMATSLTYTYGRIQAEPSNIPLDHIPPVFRKTVST